MPPQLSTNPRTLYTRLGFGTVTCQGHLICSKMQQSIYYHIVQQNLVNRLATLLHLNVHTLLDWVNWQTLKKARTECSHQMRIFMIKWVSGDTATGVVMFKRKQRLSPGCPLCPHLTEDTTHILQCPSSSSCELRTHLLEELQCWMTSVNTHPDIIHFIISGLSAWGSSLPFVLDTCIDASLLCAFKTQLTLGWEALLFGLLVSPIISYQHSYYKALGSRKSGVRWGVNLIDKLCNFIFQLWNDRITFFVSPQLYPVSVDLPNLKMPSS